VRMHAACAFNVKAGLSIFNSTFNRTCQLPCHNALILVVRAMQVNCLISIEGRLPFWRVFSNELVALSARRRQFR
jgi:hypothetical protein